MLYIIKNKEGVEVARGLTEEAVKNFLEHMEFKGDIGTLFQYLTLPIKNPRHPSYCFYTITKEEE